MSGFVLRWHADCCLYLCDGLQIIGPFSFRVDSGVAVNLHDNRKWKVNLENPVLAIEYALHVLGSAKAVAWYAPQQKEFMVELRLFER